MPISGSHGRHPYAHQHDPAPVTRAVATQIIPTYVVRAESDEVREAAPNEHLFVSNEALWAKAVGRLVRTARRVQTADGALALAMTDRRRGAARRIRQIAAKLRARSEPGREETTQAGAQVTGQLAGKLRRRALRFCATATAHCHRRATAGYAATCAALTELTVATERTAQVVAQVRTRLAGQPPGAGLAGQL